MRAVNFVKRLQWDLPGTVCRHGLTIGDVDNDGDNELVVGTAEGDLFIFKGSELWQKITGLGLVTSVAIGDIFNYGRNALVVICGDGWANIFYSPRSVNPSNKDSSSQDNYKLHPGSTNIDEVDDPNDANELSGKMECVHVQRIPTNSKIVMVADVDKDGANEMIIGLTDRVVRSYRWCSNADLGTGKLVGLNKWECANQIGTIALQHSNDGTPMLLVAQPGGTFMRIKCNPDDHHLEGESCNDSETEVSCVDYQTLGISRMRNPNISTEIIGDLELGSLPLISQIVKKQSSTETDQIITKINKTSSKLGIRDDKLKIINISSETTKTNLNKNNSSSVDEVDGNLIGGDVIMGEPFYDSATQKSSLLPSMKDFSPVRSHNDINDTTDEGIQDKDNNKNNKEESQGKPYALATLDGTIMLVKDETILWAMQVDHQIFSLCCLDVTGDGYDEIIACAWDGQTYILDQQRNSVRFQFEEPVRAFCTGKYSVVPGTSTSCFVYNTFHNKIFLYHDILLPNMLISPFDPLENFTNEEMNGINELLKANNDTEKQHKLQQLTEWLLYGSHEI